MNSNKPTKPISDILHSAASCGTIFGNIKNSIERLDGMGAKSRQIRDAYVLLKNTKTVLTQYGPTKALLSAVNPNGELEHAIKVTIPRITSSNKAEVVRTVVDGIDHATEELVERLRIYSEENLSELQKLTSSYSELAVNQKSILCDLRQYISALDYNESSSISPTDFCGYSRESFLGRISALKTIYRTLTSRWNEWNRHGLSSALNRLGYNLVIDTEEDLDPEEKPTEPLDPEMMVVKKTEVEEGSDTPIPDSEVDPDVVTPSNEAPETGTTESLVWTRKTVLDGINALVSAVDKAKEFTSFTNNVRSAVEAMATLNGTAGEDNTYNRSILSNRTYFSMCSALAKVYGREVNNLTNGALKTITQLCGRLNA